MLTGNLLNDGPCLLDVRRRDERREPAVCEPADTLELGGGDPAEPHIRRALSRLGLDTQVLVVEEASGVVDAFLGPTRAHHGEGLVEDRCTLGALHPERLLLVAVGNPEPECREQTAPGHAVECCEFLREDDGIAPRQDHHAHADLELLGATCRIGHRHEWVRCSTADAFGEPEGVEVQALERVHHGAEGLVVEAGSDTEAITNADLHDVGSVPREAFEDVGGLCRLGREG